MPAFQAPPNFDLGTISAAYKISSPGQHLCMQLARALAPANTSPRTLLTLLFLIVCDNQALATPRTCGYKC